MSTTRSLTIAAGFGASHELEGHPTCGRVHGHSYIVRATFTGEPNMLNWGYPVAEDDVAKTYGIIRELANRHLNDMIPAGYPSTAGIANYLLERLIIHGVTKVEVHESDTDVTAAAERLPG